MKSESNVCHDWGEASVVFDKISPLVGVKDLAGINEAQTRFDVIDRVIKEVLCWQHGQIHVEERTGAQDGYIDYILQSGDNCIVIEAKKIGLAFPSPTRMRQLKLNGTVLKNGEIGGAIQQANRYALDKAANVAMVTNGLCWCCFLPAKDFGNDVAHIFFPFENASSAEEFFNVFAVPMIDRGSLKLITNSLPVIENRLLSAIRDSDARVDRNNLADHILPALNGALYADALLSNPEALKRCYVASEGRTKFDSTLGMHLADIKSPLVQPARRIRGEKGQGSLQEMMSKSAPGFSPPVTLIIGPVGAGKSTYLKHFENISGKDTLDKLSAHWIYIDFEKMGKLGNPREFIYKSLLAYIGVEKPENSYENLVKPAYEEDISALLRGPLAPIGNDEKLVAQKTSEYIMKDYAAIEPYVDKVISYLAKRKLCVVVLDNVDLYEDDKLETTVFAEGLAISKRLLCHVLVTVRDTTFVKHKTDSSFDAYELRKLWLDPPEFKAVLSSRLSYSRTILKNRKARIEAGNGIHIDIDDLSKFFDIVQRSVLEGQAGNFIASFSDTNVRKGLELITNFLTSGHIQADRAIQHYMAGQTTYYFPGHEVFKGTMLNQWRYYKEGRAECINLFDSRLGSKKLRLIRLAILSYLSTRARSAETMEVGIQDCVHLFSQFGMSEEQIVNCFSELAANRLIRSITAEAINKNSTIVMTRCGGYYIQYLAGTFSYVESCLLDTAIDDQNCWAELCDLTIRIEVTHDMLNRMELRTQRLKLFMRYLKDVETAAFEGVSNSDALASVDKISKNVIQEAENAIKKIQWRKEKG